MENQEEVCYIDTLVEGNFCSEFDTLSNFIDFECNTSYDSYFVQVGENGMNAWMPKFEPLLTTEAKQVSSE